MKRLFLYLIGCFMVSSSFLMVGCKSKSKVTASETNTKEIKEDKPQSKMSNELPVPTTNVKVKMTTTYGEMIIQLYDETPKHRDNFIKLVNEKYYDSLLFHRCIKGFMIQGGDPNSRNAAPGQQLGVGGPGYTVDAEFNPLLIHKKGALAAARQGDMVNPKKSSSGSQFYIVQGRTMNDAQIDQMQAYVQQKNPGFTYTPEQRELYKTVGGTAQLDMDYTVFGEVIQGLEVIDAINSQPTAPGDRPLQNIIMKIEFVR
ncbi:MAG: peptidylprolyl isomerase [Flavobacteriales bacterium]|jgi:cyclophilin family peptidyl-prolyl cis-trans isomerase